MPGRTLVHFDSLRICYDADWRAGRTHTAAGRESHGSMLAESAVTLSMRILNTNTSQSLLRGLGAPSVPRDMDSGTLSACLPGRASPAGGVGGAAETTLWREVGLLGGLLLMIVSQTLSGG